MYGRGKSLIKGCKNCEGDCDAGCGCSCCQNWESSNCRENQPVKICVKPPCSHYVMQILNSGINDSENSYETRLILAPEIDVSSIKITVKNENLRVTARRSLGELAGQLPEILEKSALGDLVKRSIKHSENFFIPDNVDGEKVRAVMDNKQRILALTAPLKKINKTIKKRNCNKCRITT